MESVKIADINDSMLCLVKKLLDEGKRITFAESCTGGLLSKKITDISGVSACFECGFVTYSNEIKEKLLGVSHKTLSEYGAVSCQTAYEMCRGAKTAADADIAISVTGIAGPTGGSDEKPVGLVYVGICAEDIRGTVRLNLSGTREEIREKTALCAFDLALRCLEGRLKIENSPTFDIEYV